MSDKEYEAVITALADAFLDVKAAQTHIARYRELLKEREHALSTAKDNVARLHSQLVDLMYTECPTNGES